MSKVFQLTVPEPCHEDWNKMVPDEKGRFCRSCQKQVMDFTNMSERDLVAFFKKPSTGSVCGRFNNDQLNHDLQIPKKRIPWLKYFFTVAIPAFFATSKATAQGKPFVIQKEDTALVPVCRERMGDIAIKFTETPGNKVINGKVVDEDGEPLAHASIRIKGTNFGTATDSTGSFKISAPSEDAILTASYIGYEPVEITLNEINRSHLIVMKMQAREIMGEMIAVTTIRKKPVLLKEFPLIKQFFADTSFKSFKFFPNPASAGSVITIEWKKPEASEFEIQLLKQDGQAVSRKTENFTEKTNSLQFQVPSVAPGSYFLVMVNRKSGKKITEKIVVQ